MEHQQQHGIATCLGRCFSMVGHRGAVSYGHGELVQKLDAAGIVSHHDNGYLDPNTNDVWKNS